MSWKIESGIKDVGKPYIFYKVVTSASNAGNVTMATAMVQPVMVKSVIVKANGAAPANLTSIGVYGGVNQVVTFIDSALTGLKANIAATDQQVAWTGAAVLDAGDTIVMTLAGAGAAAVNLTIYVEFAAIADDGYLA